MRERSGLSSLCTSQNWFRVSPRLPAHIQPTEFCVSSLTVKNTQQAFGWEWGGVDICRPALGKLIIFGPLTLCGSLTFDIWVKGEKSLQKAAWGLLA